MKNSFPNFGNGNGRLVFPGMVGNGNSRSPLTGGTQKVAKQEYFCSIAIMEIEPSLLFRWWLKLMLFYTLVKVEI